MVHIMQIIDNKCSLLKIVFHAYIALIVDGIGYVKKQETSVLFCFYCTPL
jgi:hypothetical protein